jgi:hypothetical protein
MLQAHCDVLTERQPCASCCTCDVLLQVDEAALLLHIRPWQRQQQPPRDETGAPLPGSMPEVEMVRGRGWTTSLPLWGWWAWAPATRAQAANTATTSGAAIRQASNWFLHAPSCAADLLLLLAMVYRTRCCCG